MRKGQKLILTILKQMEERDKISKLVDPPITNRLSEMDIKMARSHSVVLVIEQLSDDSFDKIVNGEDVAL